MLTFRYADESDVDLLFNWANEESARKNSYNPVEIKYEDHVNWFSKRIDSENFYLYIFTNAEGINVGQVRIEKSTGVNEAIISISIDREHRGRGYSVEMLKKAFADFISKNKGYIIFAYIFKDNRASYKSFLKAGYGNSKEAEIKGISSYILSYSQNER